MRRPSFKGWIKAEILRKTGADSFSMRRFAALAQARMPELAPYLVFYAAEHNSLVKLLSYIWDEELHTSMTRAARALGQRDLQRVALLGRYRNQLDEPYALVMDDFLKAYGAIESKADEKRIIWERTHELLLHTGIPVSLIVKELGLNSGNLYAYMNHGDVSKMSQKNAEAILAFLENSSEQ